MEIIIGKRTQQNHKTKTKTKTGIIIASICVGVLLLIYLGFCTVASVRGTIFPNISVAGVEVGGMTLSEASAVMDRETGGAVGDGTLVVAFSEDGSDKMEVSIREVMGDVNLRDCLQDAYDYGRGNFFTGGAALISAIFSPRDFAFEAADINEGLLDNLIAEELASRSIEKVEPSYVVGEDSILISTGKPGMELNAAELKSLIMDAFKQMDFMAIEYIRPATEPKPVDLNAIYEEVYTEMVPAGFDEEFNITKEVVGISFDLEQAEQLLSVAGYGELISVPLIKEVPEVTAEFLATSLCTDVLAEYSTYVTSNSNRNTNISLASEACNGLILMPGDEFSFNGTVGERTTARGYKMAGAYVNGAVVDEVGGGICQVSSTIYMVALLSNLEITHRECHQFVVSYLPYGMDATVNWGTTDFTFKNNTKYPIKIEAWLADGAVTVRFLGTKETGNYVEMGYDITGTYPFETIEEESDTVAEGETYVKTTGSTGYSVKTYRKIYSADGTLISNEFEASSYYVKRNKVVLVPVGTLEPDPSDPVTSDPMTSDPVTSDPVTSDPVASDPVVTDPVVTDPEPTPSDSPLVVN